MTKEEAIKRLKKIDIRDALQEDYDALYMAIKAIEQEPKTGHCKDCKYFEYFEYNNVAEVDGMPHICSRWGGGCMTRENGYCFLFKQKRESEE